YHGELISNNAIAAAHHEIADLSRQLLAELSLQPIIYPDWLVRHAHPDRVSARRGQIARAAIAGIDSAVFSDKLARAVAIVGVVALDQGVQCLVVAFEILALVQDIAIPFQTIGLERAEDVIGCAWYVAWLVEVFDAYQPATAVVACVEVTG